MVGCINFSKMTMVLAGVAGAAPPALVGGSFEPGETLRLPYVARKTVRNELPSVR
jgi:hypothetical protein